MESVTNLVDAPSKCVAKAAKAEETTRTGEALARTTCLAESMGTPAFWMHRGGKYLERYAYLVLFAGYVLLATGTGEGLGAASTPSFSEWMRTHWAFKRTLRELALH